MELLVVGATQREPVDGVRFLGTIPNSQIAQYYQCSNVYLFPTLCEEGFGMSLIEALHCGCICIASEIGGVPEVLQHGKFGHLIKNPDNVNEWVEAIEKYFAGDYDYDGLPDNLYSSDQWNIDMNNLISRAKIRLEQK
jgi:glycosyltransferase involved in cell wall biosynthesis